MIRMFDSLKERLEGIFSKLRSKGRLTEEDISDALREVRRALLEADVNYKIAKDLVEDVYKRQEYFNTRLGHGIGVAIHEAPYIMEGNKMPLEPGMTFSIEPGIYIPGKIGIRIENVVVVTKDGCRPLSKLPKGIIVL